MRISEDHDDLAQASNVAARAFATLWPLLGRHIAFHRRLVDITQNVKAALLLSQCIYWTRHGRDIVERGGWFYKTSTQWELETGLTTKEQVSARTVLGNLAVLDEERHGVPGRLHFRLSVNALVRMLAERMRTEADRADGSEGVLLELLGPSVAFHRTIAEVGGGVHAGLMLSRGLYVSRRRWMRRADPWIPNSEAQWWQELGLSRREQETARRDLRRTGLWEERISGMPPRLAARIRIDVLSSRFAGRSSCQRGRSSDVGASDGVTGAGRVSQNSESRRWHFHQLVTPKPPNHILQNRTDCLAESAEPYIEVSTGSSVQPPPEPAAPNRESVASESRLVFPAELLPAEREAAMALLGGCMGDAQSLLDELSARLKACTIRTSPISYLRGLVLRANAGAFVPELGPRVAKARRDTDAALAMCEQRASEEHRLTSERETPEYEAKLAARKAEIRQILQVLKSPRQRGG